jgi:hypothetical protein
VIEQPAAAAQFEGVRLAGEQMWMTAAVGAGATAEDGRGGAEEAWQAGEAWQAVDGGMVGAVGTGCARGRG